MSIEEYNYWNDRRVIAGMMSKPKFDKKRRRLIIELETEEGEVYEEYLPAMYEVCGICQGDGMVVNPSIDSGGITDWDEYDREDYFQGAYDINCTECGGDKVVPVVDTSCLSEKQKKLYDLYLEKLHDDYEYARLCAMERAMGC